jgi:hypothetical protein
LQCGWAFHSKPSRRNNLPPALPQYGAARRRGDLVVFAIPPKADIRQCDLLVRFVPISLQKPFWRDERNFLEPLMRFARGEVRGHFISSEIDHGPPEWR